MTSSVEKELATYDRSRLLAAAKLLNDGTVTDDIAVAYAGDSFSDPEPATGGVAHEDDASLRRHELLLILDPSLDDQTVGPTIKTFLDVIRKGGGTVDHVDVWGRRRLASEIRKHVDGIYVVVTVTAAQPTVDDLRSILSLDESVLRGRIDRVNTSRPVSF